MARKRIQHPFEINGFQHSEAAHIPLDRERITQSAIRLLNEFGLKELSMRKVAEDLMVKPASLYYHVKSKDELLQWMADHISSELTQHDPSLPWAEQVLQWGEQYRRVLHNYRDAVEIFNSTIASGYNRLTQIEKLFQILAAAGFQDSQIPWMASMLKNYVLGFVTEEVQLRSIAGQHDTTQEQLSEQYNKFYNNLPKDKFPNMIRLAPYMTNTDWQSEFQFGLGVLIDGLLAKLPSVPS
ncbi:TetR/AcrR family transcriptional regulator C-terminal domain-containing protein [Paenibacillus sp. PL91]|uniref:TetR/AcrR family transcriptional regulator C-terminal domain-containing protein n=1 Tax=Paenibacillus sp. PL91 TaxID=2729538 RepID=UPI00145D4AD8|nr:TetR/AcrR family transcriptional regulator C-terminal domain-containing protein [Paenibacillus sp. PL91]MBC9198318.1 TetR/AcrR family transcriptional regulator C-terminal domain-containing protein [Paenibacillus sp. PL91]